MTSVGQFRPIAGHDMVCNCTDLKGRHGVCRLNVVTGAATPFFFDEPRSYSFVPAATRDATRIIFARTIGDGDPSVIVRDSTTGEERPLAALGADVSQMQPAISPDGRQVAYVAGKDDRSTLNVVSIDGGISRVVPGLTPNGQLVEWTSDGAMIIVSATGRGNQSIAVAVPLAGGSPVPLALPATSPHLQ
jgi:Tol biopolymer transport system component